MAKIFQVLTSQTVQWLITSMDGDWLWIEIGASNVHCASQDIYNSINRKTRAINSVIFLAEEDKSQHMILDKWEHDGCDAEYLFRMIQH